MKEITWPVVTDGKNQIIWLPGLKKCHDADTSDKVNRYHTDYYHSKSTNIAIKL